MTKRLPQQTPGAAIRMGGAGGDFTLPMELHRDAALFYVQALDAQEEGDHRTSARFVRASIIAAFSSLEAQLNGQQVGTRKRMLERLSRSCGTYYARKRQRLTSKAESTSAVEPCL